MESGTHGKGGRKLPSSLGDGSLLHQVGADRAGYMRGLGLTQVVYAATRGIASTDFPAMYWERPKDHQKTAVGIDREVKKRGQDRIGTMNSQLRFTQKAHLTRK